MHLKSHFYRIFIFFGIIGNLLFAQTFEISGTIKDEGGNKVSNARLTLYSSKYQLVKTERTRGNGKFKFKKIKPGKYTLNIYGSGGNSATKEIDLRSKPVTKLEVLTSQDDKHERKNNILPSTRLCATVFKFFHRTHQGVLRFRESIGLTFCFFVALRNRIFHPSRGFVQSI